MNTYTNAWTRVIAIASLSTLTTSLAVAEVREELHETHPITPDGRIDLDNVNGNIRITSWERDEVQLDAVKTAKKQADLDAVKIEVEAGKDRLRIHTRYPNNRQGQNNSTSVAYTLRVPHHAQLKKIEAVNGDVLIEGVQGDVEASSVNGRVTAKALANEARLSTVNGNIEAAFQKLVKDEPVSAETVNGRIVLSLPPGSNADVSANSLNGSLKSDFELKLVKHIPVGKDMSGRIGEGGTKVRAKTVNGGIEIRKGE